MHRSIPLELSLVAVGLTAIAMAVLPALRATLAKQVVRDAALAQTRFADTNFSQDGPIVPTGAITATYAAGQGDSGPSHFIGTLVMPDLQLKVPIISGIESSDLTRGVGHVPGSGYAGGLGNMAVAGHRDTFFRPLRFAKKGMDIIVRSSAGAFRYRIDRTEIVKPGGLRVLDIGDQPELTLITCYPFNFLGTAPDRFIVHAHLLSLSPEP